MLCALFKSGRFWGFAYVENHDGKKVNKLEKLIQKKSVKLKFIDGIAEALILNKNNKG